MCDLFKELEEGPGADVEWPWGRQYKMKEKTDTGQEECGAWG